MTTRTLPDGPINPYKLAHVVLRVRDLEASLHYYQHVLNARIVTDSRPFAVGLTFDEEHHRLALIGVPPSEPAADAASASFGPGAGVTDAQGADLSDVAFSVQPGLEHIAFTFDSLGSLLATYVRLRDASILPSFCINHGPTVSVYYTDPDGNKTELQIDSMTMELAQDYLESDLGRANVIGWPFDPEDLLQRYLDGEPLSELILQIGRAVPAA